VSCEKELVIKVNRMKFNERKIFLYDAELFKRNDVATALRINAEHTKKHAPIPQPKFMEVARTGTEYDPLWHMPLSTRTEFSREIDMPCLNVFEKPDWRLTKAGIVPQRRDKFLCSNLILQQYDYFPERGDMVFWNGYRYMINNVVLPPEAYWHQTNVWLGLYCECVVVPDGDVRPLPNMGEVAPAEQASLFTKVPYKRPLPEVDPSKL
jgi:hypothetical protein